MCVCEGSRGERERGREEERERGREGERERGREGERERETERGRYLFLTGIIRVLQIIYFMLMVWITSHQSPSVTL